MVLPRALKSSTLDVWTAMKNGPFTPGPKPSARRSNPVRWGLPGAALESSGKPNCIEAAGRASPPTIANAISAGIIGLRCKSLPYEFQRETFGLKACGCLDHGARRLSALAPSSESSAGSIHSADNITKRTATAAARARPLKKLMRSTNMPSRATMTVDPANITALPAVPTAVSAASLGLNSERTP